VLLFSLSQLLSLYLMGGGVFIFVWLLFVLLLFSLLRDRLDSSENCFCEGKRNLVVENR